MIELGTIREIVSISGVIVPLLILIFDARERQRTRIIAERSQDLAERIYVDKLSTGRKQPITEAGDIITNIMMHRQ